MTDAERLLREHREYMLLHTHGIESGFIEICSGCKLYQQGIDKLIAAARWAALEGAHARRCQCHDRVLARLPETDDGVRCQCKREHPYTDPRCQAMRDEARKRAEEAR